MKAQIAWAVTYDGAIILSSVVATEKGAKGELKMLRETMSLMFDKKTANKALQVTKVRVTKINH